MDKTLFDLAYSDTNIYEHLLHDSIFAQHVGAIAITSGRFGETNLPTLMEEVSCAGDESTLLQCSHRIGSDSSCGPTEDAAIVCQGIMIM